jgi:hypothetical protein
VATRENRSIAPFNQTNCEHSNRLATSTNIAIATLDNNQQTSLSAILVECPILPLERRIQQKRFVKLPNITHTVMSCKFP